MQIDGIDYYKEPGQNFALSQQVFVQEFMESTNLVTNEFLNIGLLRTSTIVGMPVTQDIKIIGLDWQNTSGASTTIFVYSAAKGVTGVVVGTIAIGAGLQGVTATNINIPAGNFIALQWGGSSNANPIFLLKYRLKYTL